MRDAIMTPEFIDNIAIGGRASHYVAVEVEVAQIMKSWQKSLFAYEWLRKDGTIKTRDELSTTEQSKRRAVEDRIARGEPHQKPILGIGIMDNIEIGSGRPTFLTLAALGAKTLPVHIAIQHRDEFKRYLA